MNTPDSKASLSPAQVQQAFACFDTDNSGTIDQSEFTGLCWKLGMPLKRHQIESAFVQVDTNGGGEICLEEFEAWMTSKDAISYTGISADLQQGIAQRMSEGGLPHALEDSEKPDLHPFWLRFKDPGFERFHRTYQSQKELGFRRLVLNALLFVVFVFHAGLNVMEYASTPDTLHTQLVVRFSFLPAFCILWCLLNLNVFAEVAQGYTAQQIICLAAIVLTSWCGAILQSPYAGTEQAKIYSTLPSLTLLVATVKPNMKMATIVLPLIAASGWFIDHAHGTTTFSTVLHISEYVMACLLTLIAVYQSDYDYRVKTSNLMMREMKKVEGGASVDRMYARMEWLMTVDLYDFISNDFEKTFFVLDTSRFTSRHFTETAGRGQSKQSKQSRSCWQRCFLTFSDRTQEALYWEDDKPLALEHFKEVIPEILILELLFCTFSIIEFNVVEVVAIFGLLLPAWSSALVLVQKFPRVAEFPRVMMFACMCVYIFIKVFLLYWYLMPPEGGEQVPVQQAMDTSDNFYAANLCYLILWADTRFDLQWSILFVACFFAINLACWMYASQIRSIDMTAIGMSPFILTSSCFEMACAGVLNNWSQMKDRRLGHMLNVVMEHESVDELQAVNDADNAASDIILTPAEIVISAAEGWVQKRNPDHVSTPCETCYCCLPDTHPVNQYQEEPGRM